VRVIYRQLLPLLVLLALTYGLAALFAAGPRSALFAADAPRTQVPRQGFHRPEDVPDQTRRYRWTTGSAMLRLPNPGGAVLVRLGLAAGPERSTPLTMRVSGTAHRFDVGPDLRVYQLLAPPSSGARIALLLESPIFTQPPDARPLGVVVSEVAVRGGQRLPAALLAVVLSVATAAYLLLRALRLRPWAAAGGALLGVVFVLGVQTNAWRYALLIPTSVVLLSLLGGVAAGARMVGAGAARAQLPPRAWRYLAAGALLAATLAYLAPYLRGDKTFIPYDLLGQVEPWDVLGGGAAQNRMMWDVVLLHAPWRVLYRAVLLGGEWPFWNPYVFGGMPLLANHQSAVLYPLNLLFVPLSLETGFVWFVGLHLFGTGLGAYMLLRRLELAPPAALVGALAWMLNGFLTAWRPWLATSDTIAWLPWCLLAADLAVRGGRRGVGALALALALATLAGHSQYLYYIVLTTGAWALLRAWGLPNWRTRGAGVLRFAGGCLLGAALGSLQLYATFELSRANTRAATPTSDLIGAAVPTSFWPTLLVPEFYGNAGELTTGVGNFVEQTGYVGLLTLALALLALLHPALRRQPALWFFGGLAALTLHLVYGGVLTWLFDYLPAFDAFRVHSRLYSVWALAAAALAAYGVEAVLAATGWRRHLIGGAGLLVGLGLAGLLDADTTVAWAAVLGQPIINPERAGWLAAPLRWAATMSLLSGLAVLAALHIAKTANQDTKTQGKQMPIFAPGSWLVVLVSLAPALVIAVDLLHFARSYLPVVDVARAYPLTPGLAYLVAHRDEGRVARYNRTSQEKPLPTNIGTVYGLEDIQGYGSFTIDRHNRVLGAIEPARYETAAQNRPGAFRSRESLGSPLLDMLGVSFLLTARPVEGMPAGWDAAYVGPDMTVYRNREVLPIAWLVGAATVHATLEAQQAAIAAAAFDPRRTAVLETNPALPLDPAATGTARVVGRGMNWLRLDVEVDAAQNQAGLLVVRQNNYPGWSARVAGRAVPLLNANVSLQALALPPGRHSVELRFAPSYWPLLSMLSLGALVVVSGLLWQRRPHPRGVATGVRVPQLPPQHGR
jgi:hypothetical protein